MTILEARKMVDEIRAYIDSPDQTKDERIAALATTYAEACRDANARLQRCGEFLGKAHRPEAIALAEAEPDLLQFVSVLTFSNVDQWQEIVAGYGWERPQPIKMEIASIVGEAYTIEKQLGELLRTHRRLAVSRAPLKTRLATMRKIAQMDTTTPFWREDVSNLEVHRFEELADLGRRAMRSNDPQGSSLQQFVEEFESESFSSPVSPDLQNTFQVIYVRFHEGHTFPRLANQLSGALRKLAVAELTALREQWMAIVQRIQAFKPDYDVPPALRAQAQAALNYLKHHEDCERNAAFQRDLDLLHQSMHDDESIDKVDFLAAAAESHGFPLPRDTQAELAQFRTAARRENYSWTILIITLCAAGISMLVLAYFFMRTALDNKVPSGP